LVNKKHSEQDRIANWWYFQCVSQFTRVYWLLFDKELGEWGESKKNEYKFDERTKRGNMISC